LGNEFGDACFRPWFLFPVLRWRHGPSRCARAGVSRGRVPGRGVGLRGDRADVVIGIVQVISRGLRGAGLGVLPGKIAGLRVVAVGDVRRLAAGAHRVLQRLAQPGIGQRVHIGAGTSEGVRVAGAVIASSDRLGRQPPGRGVSVRSLRTVRSVGTGVRLGKARPRVIAGRWPQLCDGV
jgi:hypothetical protein